MRAPQLYTISLEAAPCRFGIEKTQVTIFVVFRKDGIALDCKADHITLTSSAISAILSCSKGKVQTSCYFFTKFLANIGTKCKTLVIVMYHNCLLIHVAN